MMMVKSDSLRVSEKTKQLDVLLEVMDEWRKLDPELTVNALCTFVAAARHDGEWTLTDIAKRMGMELATPGRNLQAFEAINRHKEPGFNFIEKKRDPMKDSRSWTVHLTRQGRAFVDRVLTPLNRLAA